MKYDDLLSVPYVIGGRSMEGMDCYGLVLELARRNNQQLHDVVYVDDKVPGEFAEEYIRELNVKEINRDELKAGDVIQMDYNGNMHIGYMITDHEYMHMTYEGARISPVKFAKIENCVRIKK